MPSDEGGVRVVVGVDGSDGSIAALRFALEEARMRGGVLEVVYAYDSPTSIDLIPHSSHRDDLLGAARRDLEEMIAGSLGPAGTSPPLRRTVVAESPGSALVNAGRGAALLVIGFRGHSTFREFLLGSTSHHCVHHAPCPVTVVRDSH